MLNYEWQCAALYVGCATNCMWEKEQDQLSPAGRLSLQSLDFPLRIM